MGWSKQWIGWSNGWDGASDGLDGDGAIGSDRMDVIVIDRGSNAHTELT